MGQRQYIRDTSVMRHCPSCSGTQVNEYRHPPANGRRGDYATSTRCADPSCNRLLHYSPTTLATPGATEYNMWEGTRSTYNEPAPERGIGMVMPRG